MMLSVYYQHMSPNVPTMGSKQDRQTADQSKHQQYSPAPRYEGPSRRQIAITSNARRHVAIALWICRVRYAGCSSAPPTPRLPIFLDCEYFTTFHTQSGNVVGARSFERSPTPELFAGATPPSETKIWARYKTASEPWAKAWTHTHVWYVCREAHE